MLWIKWSVRVLCMINVISLEICKDISRKRNRIYFFQGWNQLLCRYLSHGINSMQQENDHVLLSFHSSPKKGDNWFDLSFGVIIAWLKLIQNQNWTKLFASFLKRCFISFGVSLKYFLYTSEILILKTSKWPIFVNWWIHFTKISHLSVKTYKACNISIFFFSFRRLSFIIFLNFSNWFYLSIR